MGKWVNIIVGLLVLYVFLTNIGIPWAAEFFTSFRLRVAKITPRSVYGFEWRSKAHPCEGPPTLRVERIYWTWGGCTTRSVVALNVDGVTFRAKKSTGHKTPKVPKKKKRVNLPPAVQRIVNYFLHLFLSNWSSIVSLLSIHILNVRVIAEDVHDVEVRISEVRFGVSRDDASSRAPVHDGDTVTPPRTPPNTPWHSPAAGSARSHHRASSIQMRMSQTASRIWSHATGRVVERVSFTALVGDVAVLVPQTPVAGAAWAAAGAPTLPHIAPQQSGTSVTAPPTLPFTIESLLKRRPASQSSQAQDEDAYDQLLVIESTSTVQLSVGFGSNRPILTEDNLRTSVEIGTLHASLDALEILQAMIKASKAEEQANGSNAAKAAHGASSPESKPRSKSSPWAPQATPRVILRAFDSVAFSVSRVYVSHLLPVPPTSVRSSVTEMTAFTPSANLYHTLSLDLTDLRLRVSGTNSAEDSWLGKVFGTNPSAQTLIRGISANLQWTAIELHCIQPGETARDKVQLLAIRQAEFDVVTTWRPIGWTRRELSFSNDKNLSFAMARGSVASIDAAGDVQLVDELKAAVRHSHPPQPRPPRSERKPLGLPPRINLVLQMGPTCIALANRASKDSATLTLSSDGLCMSTNTWFTDVVRSMSSESTAEDDIRKTTRATERGRRNAVDDAASVKSQNSQKDDGEVVNLDEDAPVMPSRAAPPPTKPPLSLSMHGTTHVTVDPISLRMTLGTRNETTHRLATVGRMEGSLNGSVLAAENASEEGRETFSLCLDTVCAESKLLIDDGIQVELWDPTVLDALVQIASLKEPNPPKPPSNLLDKLPNGVTFRLALGRISVFIGHDDQNPHCSLRLVRGMWLQLGAVIDYARYGSSKSMGRCGHLLDNVRRGKLKLFDDITANAFKSAARLETVQGHAGLISITLTDTSITPVINGAEFMDNGGADQVVEAEDWKRPPKPEEDPAYAAWGWKGHKRREQFGMPEPAEFTQTPHKGLAPSWFLRVPFVFVTARVYQRRADALVETNVSARVQDVHLNAVLADVYCTLLAVRAVRRLANAFKKPPGAGAVKKTPPRVSLAVLVPTIWLRCMFPLREPMFLSVSTLRIDKPIDKKLGVAADHILVHVRSAAHLGFWDEFGLIKKFQAEVDSSNVITVSAKALRIRIPYAFVLSQLILNINVTIKAIKLLLNNIKHDEFKTVKMPISEGPKRVPNIKIRVDLLHIEARDHPVETRINLANRVGLIEQRSRISLEDMFDHKVTLLNETDSHPVNHLTHNQTVSNDEAQYRLRWHISRCWVKRIKRAKEEQRRRETAMHAKFSIHRDHRLPINTLPLDQTTPLLRAAFSGVSFGLAPPQLTRAQLVKYMSDVSTPFAENQQFSLFVPFQVEWTMGEAKVTIRDYPLSLFRIPSAKKGPAWRVTTLFVIAEELCDEDSCLFIPVEVLPEQCGHPHAQPLRVQIAKTLNPTKTYARPVVKIMSPDPFFTYCQSYQPGLSDVSRVVETLSHPPRDPSVKPGWWDKLRLILHWKVIIDFAGTMRFYLKGSMDPYSLTGYGSGFALVWRKNVRCEVNQPNPQYEVVQVMSDELLVTIPDLTGLHDNAAVGNEPNQLDPLEADRKVIEKRSLKPCARFLNGVRFGLGFRFERTCRPWSCIHGCGETDNLFHRQCRIFEFEPHQSVVLRTPEAIERIEADIGRAFDSYEGFRSDYVHFSVSLVAPREDDPVEVDPFNSGAETHNSLHLSPKAFAHFFAWWHLFGSKIPAPIRQGPAFPDTPSKAKKFGKSLGTIKYRMDLAPVYLAHNYYQVSQDLWSEGRSQNLGIKLRVGRLRIDGHQRMQEKRDWNERLNVHKTITHKPFYAADLLVDEIIIKGTVADFNETQDSEDTESIADIPKASQLPPDLREWYNFFDFIDADRKPFDHDPRMQIVHLGDCPHVFLSRRVKARSTAPDTGDDASEHELEATKFGHEKTHVCYLGAALGVGPMQSQIAQERVAELQVILEHLPPPKDYEKNNPRSIRNNILQRIQTLQIHIDDLAHRERRHMDDNTLEPHDTLPESGDTEELSFQNTVHVHCPRLFYNNQTRNIIFKYLYSRRNRQKEEYITSHASLRGVRNSVNRRMQRTQNGLNKDDLDATEMGMNSRDLLEYLEKIHGEGNTARFKIVPEFFTDISSIERTALGLPSECTIHPHWRMLFLKPQVALRSDADSSAVVLMALEEVSFRKFAIKDTQGLDQVTQDVMSRNYVALKGLQSFYPTRETLQRQLRSSEGLDLDFLPLEIFLDVRSEATDYERIVLKTDMAISFDRFNSLRMSRGLEWPIVNDEWGNPVDHLRKHQNMTHIVVPMITVSATSEHYTALYYIVTDLLMYEDPQQVVRSKKIDNFMFRYDRRDRDPQQLLLNLFVIQQHIRNLGELQRGYEANVDRLTDKGRRELFNIRTDLLNESDSLFTVFEVINISRSREEARESMKTYSRLEVRAGNIAWHMLRDDGEPLLKLNIKHTLAAMENNKDGSSDSAIVVGDLVALNSNADAVYPEVLSRYTRGDAKHKHRSKTFISCSLAFLPQVGGIDIVKDFELYLYPVRFRLEEEVGDKMYDYIFNDRTRKPEPADDASIRHLDRDDSSIFRASNVDLQDASLTAALVAPHNGRPQTTTHSDTIMNTSDDEEADEMQRRASTNRTFVAVVVGSTTLVLDYKRDDKKKHGTLVWPECVDFRLQVPQMEYYNKVWAWADMFNGAKKDITKSAWSQKGDIMSQVLKKTSIFRSKKNLRHIAGITTDLPSVPQRRSPKSPLRFTVQSAQPFEMGDDSSIVGVAGPSSANPLGRNSMEADLPLAGSATAPGSRRQSVGSMGTPHSPTVEDDSHEAKSIHGRTRWRDRLRKHHKHEDDDPARSAPMSPRASGDRRASSYTHMESPSDDRQMLSPSSARRHASSGGIL